MTPHSNNLSACYEGRVHTAYCELVEIERLYIPSALSLSECLHRRVRNTSIKIRINIIKMAMTPPMTPTIIGRVLIEDVSWVVSDVGTPGDTGVSLGVMAGGGVRDTDPLVVAVGGRL